jgi:hypothetical protein
LGTKKETTKWISSVKKSQENWLSKRWNHEFLKQYLEATEIDQLTLLMNRKMRKIKQVPFFIQSNQNSNHCQRHQHRILFNSKIEKTFNQKH